MNLRLDSYKNTGTDILRHAQNMFELFENAPTSYLQGTTQEKRKLLKMLCSNFSYNGETLTITIKKAFQILFEIASLKMVGPERLELSQIAPLDPKSSASTNFATGPLINI